MEYFLTLAIGLLVISWFFAAGASFKNKSPWWQKVGMLTRFTAEGSLLYFLWTFFHSAAEAFGLMFYVFRMMGVPL